MCTGTAGKVQVGTGSAPRPVDEIFTYILLLHLVFVLFFVFDVEVLFGLMPLIALRISLNSCLMSWDVR